MAKEKHARRVVRKRYSEGTDGWMEGQYRREWVQMGSPIRELDENGREKVDIQPADAREYLRLEIEGADREAEKRRKAIKVRDERTREENADDQRVIEEVAGYVTELRIALKGLR